MSGPRFTQITQSLPDSVPFVGPETQERARQRGFVARLGANESVYGPSPRAVEAMSRAAAQSWKYGDPENHDLRAALAAHHGVAMENIVVGEGIDGLLGYLVRLTVAPGDPVVTSEGGYPTFDYHVMGYGGTLHRVPFRDDHEDVDALLAKGRETGAKLIYLANPDNPMGSWHKGAYLADRLANVPGDSLLILDEAYIDLAPEGTAPPLDVDNPNVIRMRTFSKAYGMAGARVGYAIGAPEVIAAFNKIRNHFAMARIGQAGALAALEDQAHLNMVRQNVRQAREKLERIAAGHGLHALPSATNFVAIDCGRDGEFARRVLQGLIARDIFVRMPFRAPQDRCIRVTCATSADLAAFADALGSSLRDARADIGD